MLGSKIVLLANLQGVEKRKPRNNIQVLKLDVVTHTFHEKADGSWTSKQEHHYPLVFGKMVERVEKNATKGKLVLIEGVVSYPKGRPKEIIANEIRFLNTEEGMKFILVKHNSKDQRERRQNERDHARKTSS